MDITKYYIICLDYHNYHSITDVKYIIENTISRFQTEYNVISKDSFEWCSKNELDLRKTFINDIIGNSIADHSLQAFIKNPQVSTIDLLQLAHEVNDILDTGINNDELTTLLTRKIDTYSRYQGHVTNSVDEELDRIHSIDKFSLTDTYYFSEVNLACDSNIFTITLAGNLLGSHFLDPLIISNVENECFNYFPTGLLNSVQLELYLIRLNFQLKQRNRRIALIMHNNIIVDDHNLSNIKLIYINAKLDKHFQQTNAYLKFPDDYGLNHWLKSNLSQEIERVSCCENVSTSCHRLISAYNNCISKLLHHPTYNYFNLLNIRKSGFVDNVGEESISYNVGIQQMGNIFVIINEKYHANEDLDGQRISQNGIFNYNYSGKDVYSILSKVLQFKNWLKPRDSRHDLNDVLQTMVNSVYPYLMVHQKSALNNFNEFMSDLLQDRKPKENAEKESQTLKIRPFHLQNDAHIFALDAVMEMEKELISTSDTLTKIVDGSSAQSNVERSDMKRGIDTQNLLERAIPEYDGPNQLQIDEKTHRESYQHSASIKSSEHDFDKAKALKKTSKKRKISEEPIPTIKKSKILEVLKQNKLNFVDSRDVSIFSEDSDASDNSFDPERNSMIKVNNSSKPTKLNNVESEPIPLQNEVLENKLNSPSLPSQGQNGRIEEQNGRIEELIGRIEEPTSESTSDTIAKASSASSAVADLISKTAEKILEHSSPSNLQPQLTSLNLIAPISVPKSKKSTNIVTNLTHKKPMFRGSMDFSSDSDSSISESSESESEKHLTSKIPGKTQATKVSLEDSMEIDLTPNKDANSNTASLEKSSGQKPTANLPSQTDNLVQPTPNEKDDMNVVVLQPKTLEITSEPPKPENKTTLQDQDRILPSSNKQEMDLGKPEIPESESSSGSESDSESSESDSESDSLSESESESESAPIPEKKPKLVEDKGVPAKSKGPVNSSERDSITLQKLPSKNAEISKLREDIKIVDKKLEDIKILDKKLEDIKTILDQKLEAIKILDQKLVPKRLESAGNTKVQQTDVHQKVSENIPSKTIIKSGDSKINADSESESGSSDSSSDSSDSESESESESDSESEIDSKTNPKNDSKTNPKNVPTAVPRKVPAVSNIKKVANEQKKPQQSTKQQAKATVIAPKKLGPMPILKQVSNPVPISPAKTNQSSDKVAPIAKRFQLNTLASLKQPQTTIEVKVKNGSSVQRSPQSSPFKGRTEFSSDDSSNLSSSDLSSSDTSSSDSDSDSDGSESDDSKPIISLAPLKKSLSTKNQK